MSMLCYCIIDSRLGLNTNFLKKTVLFFTFKLPIKVHILFYHFYNFPPSKYFRLFFKFLLKRNDFDILYWNQSFYGSQHIYTLSYLCLPLSSSSFLLLFFLKLSSFFTFSPKATLEKISDGSWEIIWYKKENEIKIQHKKK